MHFSFQRLQLKAIPIMGIYLIKYAAIFSKAGTNVQTGSLNIFTYLYFFGSFGNEPMQSCSVRCVSLSLLALALASVYSPPSDRFDHRSFISYKYMQLCP